MIKFNRVRFCETGFRLFLSALIVLLSSLSMPGIMLADEPEEMQKVVVIILYAPNCGACQVVLDKVLPPIVSRHNGQLEVLALDVSLPIHKNVVSRLRKELDVTWSESQLPVILLADEILVGSTQIEAEFSDLVDKYSLEGGADYPPTYYIVEEAISKPAGLALIGGNIVCGTMVLILAGIALVLRGQLSKEKRRKPSDIPTSYASTDRTLLALIGLVESNIDILSSCSRFLYLRGRRDKDVTVADANGLIQNLLNTVQRVSGITPLEEYGAVVEYKPDCHTISQGRIRPGAKFRVIETGWRLGDTIISNAIVERI